MAAVGSRYQRTGEEQQTKKTTCSELCEPARAQLYIVNMRIVSGVSNTSSVHSKMPKYLFIKVTPPLRRDNIYTHVCAYMYTHTHIYIYIYNVQYIEIRTTYKHEAEAE
jgi:hypothetical protein